MSRPAAKRKASTDELYAVEILHDYNVDLIGRELFLFGEEDQGEEGMEPGVEFCMANRFVRNIRALSRRSRDPILIHMKTCGGLWEEGMAIFDAIASCPAPTTILSYTHARSMSSIILQAATWRVMMPHSIFLFHLGTSGYEGDTQAVMSQTDWEKQIIIPQMLRAYAERLRATRWGKFYRADLAKIERWLTKKMRRHNDVYLTAEQAVEIGFADEVFDGKWNQLTTK